MKTHHFLFWLVIFIYLGSLFTESIVYQPTLGDNPKYVPCSLVFDEHGQCETLTDDGYACGMIGESKTKDTTSKQYQEQASYCGNDWNQPMSASTMGYFILITGAFGILIGSFAWFANVLFFIAIATYRQKNYIYARAFSLGALALGLQSIFIKEIPRNEGGVNNFIVDHLSTGFYLWLLSFALLTLMSMYQLRINKKKNT